MAILNSAALLNMGADAVKKSANTVTPASQSGAPEEFAQALRKQIQQSHKPAATPRVQPEPAKAAVTSTTNNKAPAASEQNRAQVNNDAAAKEASHEDTAADTQAQASGERETTATETTASTQDTTMTETPQARKKRLLEALNDPAASTSQDAAGMTPWMQTMIAMRAPAAATPSPQDDSSLTTAQAPTDAALSAVADAFAKSETTPTLPAVTSDAQASAAQGTDTPAPTTDFKQVLGDFSQAKAESPTSALSDTLANAKLFAANAALDPGLARAAAQGRGADAGIESMNTLTQPVAQALPNSPWLSAAGVAESSPVVMSQVATPFGNERWQAAMNQHVMNMVGSGDEVASLTLSPPDLGPIQVVLKVDNQSVNTSFVTDNPLVRQALEDGLQDLRDRMGSQGLQLGQTFIGNGQQAQQHFEQQTPRQASSALASSADTEAVAAPQTGVRSRAALGLVDTFV